jgi:hypothetical protein
MPVPFADYLDAKFALDERSLNRNVREAFMDALHSLPRVQCLDVGAGTCATVRRFLNTALTKPLSVTLLDRDPGLLDIARREIPDWLRALGLDNALFHLGFETQGAQPIRNLSAGDVQQAGIAV